MYSSCLGTRLASVSAAPYIPIFRIDRGLGRDGMAIEGATAVARQVLSRGRRFAGLARPAVVNGAAAWTWVLGRGRSR
jgi:hypothetical protein